jgi:hypothetical protein
MGLTASSNFGIGSVGFDTENGDAGRPKTYGNKMYLDPAMESGFGKSVPYGDYHLEWDGHSQAYIHQNILCMKTNVDLEAIIELPRDVPFYLMSHLGACQIVRGMHHTPVELVWATEWNHITPWTESATFDTLFIELEMNSWGRMFADAHRDTLPDGHFDQDYISINYCFYQPNTIEVKVDNTNNFDDGYDPVSMGFYAEYDRFYRGEVNTLCEEPTHHGANARLFGGV